MGQQIAQLPIFSGSGYRAIVLAVAVLMSVAYTMRYARRVRAHPSGSLTYDTDLALRNQLLGKEQDTVSASPRQVCGGAFLVMFLLLSPPS